MAPPDARDSLLTPSLGRLEQRIGALEKAVGELRALLIRAYENTPEAAGRVLRARRADGYRKAYTAGPLITVRIGTHGGGDLLFERALRSVRRQTYTNWEAVIVFDGPEPKAAERLASLGDQRIRCVQRPRNGPYPTEEQARWQVAGAHPFNEAVARARGAWIAPIDDDDEWSDDHLAVLLAAALDSEAEVVFGVARVIVADDGETYFGAWPPEEGDFGFQTAIYHAGLAAMLYDANSHLVGEVADWHLARRMLEAGVRFDFIERIVTTYYVKPSSPGIDWWRSRLRQRGPFASAIPQHGDLDLGGSSG